MWYVIQTKAGREAYVQQLVEKTVDSSLYSELFIPKYEVMKRYHGQWQRRAEPLFTGYLFVITNTVEALAAALRPVPALTKVLGANNLFTPLNDEEVRVIDAFTNTNHRVVDISEGIIEGDTVVLFKGPLMGHEALIKKIDRHKRIAYVELELCGRRKQVKVGLEIIRKS